MESLPTSDELITQIMGTIEVAWRNRLDLPAINRWLDNYTGEAIGDAEKERNLALWLLYNFTYYNEEEIKHLCKLLLRKYLHRNMKKKEICEQDINDVLKKTSFFPLGRSSESGSYVLYLFRQENDLPVTFFDNGQEICNENKIVFIDDMTLSGHQATRSIARIKYGDYRLREEDISDDFIRSISSEKKNSIKKYIWDRLTCDKRNKEKIANVINRQIIENNSFYENIQKEYSFEGLTGNAIELVERYNNNRDDMSKFAIYKMNRLLLEFAFTSEMKKSREIIANERIVLLTFIASEKAKSFLAQEKIEVINCIDLDEMSMTFSDNSMAFSAYPKEKEECKRMCEFYGKKINPDHPLGYDGCQFLLGLYYTIPNNTLPVFWGSDDWNPLFIRHEKRYGGNADVSGKFI